MYTVSAHFGKKMSRDHNIRNPKIVDAESHIEKGGYYKILEDRTVRQAYLDTFGHYVTKYNAKQTRSDRRINDYLTKVLDQYRKDPKRNPATSHEVIFTIGNKDRHPSVEDAEKALTAFLERFKKDNPNIVVFGAYFHADEPGAAPHMHVDYLMIKRQNKRGLEVQISQEGALREMGFVTEGSKRDKNLVTAQTKWQTVQREKLRKLAKEQGLDVEEKGEYKNERQHLDTEIFKRKTMIKELEDEYKLKNYLIDNTRNELMSQQVELASVKNEIELLELKADSIKSDINLHERVKELEEENSLLRESINILQRAFDLVKETMKRFTTERENKKVSIWKIFKESLFEKAGKKEYDDFQKVRHSTHLNQKLHLREMDLLSGGDGRLPGWDYDR